jgi:hypothetical protein
MHPYSSENIRKHLLKATAIVVVGFFISLPVLNSIDFSLNFNIKARTAWAEGQAEQVEDVDLSNSNPTITSIDTSECGGKIFLSWNFITGAEVYNVYRGGVLIHTTPNLNFQDPNLNPGVGHSYFITAENSSGESSQSQTVNTSASLECPTLFIGISDEDESKDVCQDAGFGPVIAKWEWTGGSFEKKKEVDGYSTSISGDAGSLSWTSNPAVAGLVSKEATNYFTHQGGESGIIEKTGQHDISFVAFCGIAEDDESDDEPEEPPVIDNTCLLPESSNIHHDAAFGTSSEPTLQEVLDDNGYVLNVLDDQINYQIWNTEDGTESVSFKVKILAKHALNKQVFGYYTDGDKANFVGIFEVGDNSDYDLPIMSVGDVVEVVIPTESVSSIGFAIDTEKQEESNSQFFTEVSNNSDAEGHFAVFNPSVNTFILGMEDFVSSEWDRDFQDLVIEISNIECLQGEECSLPSITSESTAEGVVGEDFSYTITATSTGTSTVSFTIATSSLPDGLIFSDDTISGIPTETGEFVILISATNDCGEDVQELVITINPADDGGAPPSTSLTANPDTIFEGATSTLTWTSTNTTSCSADWTQATSTSGVSIVSPATTTDFLINCTGPNGNATSSATVTVVTETNFPTVSLSADPENIILGATSTLIWSSANTTQCLADWTSATSTSGTQTVSPTSTTFYLIECTGPGGSATTSATVTVSESEEPEEPEIPTNGGGGGGGDDGGSGGGGGTHRRTPVITTQGQVLGATTCDYLRDYLRIDWNNDPTEVVKLQAFLRFFEGFSGLEINGKFDQATFDAVAIFQERYFDDILRPWGHDSYTGFVYILTKKKVNEIFCQSAFPLTASQDEEIRLFREFLTLTGGGIFSSQSQSSSDEGGVGGSSGSSNLSGGIAGAVIERGESETSGTGGGLIKNQAIRNVAAVIFSKPESFADGISTIIIFLIALAILYLLSNAVVKGIGKGKTVSVEKEQTQKISVFALGLVLVIALSIFFKIYLLVLPLVIFFLILILFLAWKLAVKAGGGESQQSLMKVD